MRPLSIREPPPLRPGGAEGPSTGSGYLGTTNCSNNRFNDVAGTLQLRLRMEFSQGRGRLEAATVIRPHGGLPADVWQDVRSPFVRSHLLIRCLHRLPNKRRRKPGGEPFHPVCLPSFPSVPGDTNTLVGDQTLQISNSFIDPFYTKSTANYHLINENYTLAHSCSYSSVKCTCCDRTSIFF